uniref:Purple acid phosphatase n=1 Tax=Parastrongyloides trichosuri TaxID=131310 RepID=A0A0N4ZIJ6_PARTI
MLIFILFFIIHAIANNHIVIGVENVHEQVHISLTKNPQSMVISWVTLNPFNDNTLPTVEFGLSKDTLNFEQTGSTVTFKHINGNITRYFHKVILTNLSFNTTYYYRVGDSKTWSKLFYFHTFPEGNSFDVKFCVFGDMDTGKNFTIIALTEAVKNKECDIIFHIGDIAYQLQKDDGLVGDDFMRQIEPIAAYVPYMVIDGNHEFDCYGFSHYNLRFVMPTDGDNEEDHYYSFNVGPISFIGLSSEIYGYYVVYGPEPIKKQGKWLEKKLVNINRNKNPWIISYLHRPLYCFTKYHIEECNEYENSMIRRGYGDMPGLEEYFHKYSVDLVLYGHEHSYERNYPVYNRTVYQYTNNIYYNSPATTYILSGAGGCERCTVEKEISNTEVLPFSATRSLEIGYTLIHVLNHTHIKGQQIGTENKKIIDSYWIVKDIGFNMSSPRRSSEPQGIYRPFNLPQPNFPYLEPTGYINYCLANSNMTLFNDTKTTAKKAYDATTTEDNGGSFAHLSIIHLIPIFVIYIITNNFQ